MLWKTPSWCLKNMRHNIFADLGMADPEKRLVKSTLSILIERRIKKLSLTQAQAAEFLGLSETEMSRMLRGMTKEFEIKQMIAAFTALGGVVEAPADGDLDGLTEELESLLTVEFSAE